MQDQREYLKISRKGLYSKIGLNMTPAEEEASIKRVLRIRYNAIDIAGLNLNQVKSYLVGEIEEELFYLIPSGASVQTIQRILYGKSGWDQTQIDTFELQHDPQDDADIFELRLTEAVAATLYDEYVGPRDVEKKPEKPKSRNRFPQRKRKSPRKDRNQSIEELDVSDSELAELVESKELHEEWAAFRIENDSSTEDYNWLEQPTFQNIDANNMDNYFEHSRSKLPTKKKLADLATSLMDKMEVIKKKYPHLPKNTQKLEEQVRKTNKLFREHSKLKVSKKILNGYVRELNILNGKIAAVKKFNILTKRVERLLSRIKQGEYSKSQFLVSGQEIESLCKRWEYLGWAVFRTDHQETIENHLSDEEYAWLEREIPEAVKPIGFRSLKKMWKREKDTPQVLWEKGKNTPKLLWDEIGHNTQGISEAKEEVQEATKNIQSYQKYISTFLKEPFSEEALKKYMKLLKPYVRRRNKDAIINYELITATVEKLRPENKKLLKNQAIWTTLIKRNKELRAFIASMEHGFWKGNKSTARLLTPQEAETVIFW